MATATIDGISTRYEVVGSGEPLLMYSPGGFDATIEKWSTQGIYEQIKFLDQLSKKYSCIVFDRRETGHSGGRVERVTWAHYVEQGKGLLDHLGIDKAHLMGGCMGCSAVSAFGAPIRKDAEHGPVLAGWRGEISHDRSPAVCRTPGFRQPERARGCRQPGEGKQQGFRRRSARRPLGVGHPQLSRFCRPICGGSTSTITRLS